MIIFIYAILILIINVMYFIKIKNNDIVKLDYYREIPNNENPAIVGLMVKNNIDGNDVIATLLDLNYRGYIEINYQLVGNIEKSILTLTNKDRIITLKDYENFLLDEIFKENNSIVFDDFVSSKKFDEIFKSFGNMIKKRVDLKSTHRISNKKNISKINFIANFLTFGFSISFSFLFLLLRNNIDVLFILLLSYLISSLLFLLYRSILENSKYKLDQLIVNHSYIVIIVEFGILIILYLIDQNIFINENLIYIIFNIVSSLIIIFSFIYPLMKKKELVIIDYYFVIYGIISIFFTDMIGICLCIIYLSLEIYLLSPNHINIKDNIEIDKWIALKKFLNDFTMINEREEKDVNLWEKYLIYAISMGVNKKCILKYSELLRFKLFNENILDKFYIEQIDL